MNTTFQRIQGVLGVLGGIFLVISCNVAPTPALSTPALSTPALSTPAPTLTSQSLTTYYVDNRSGSNCSNSGAGTSSSAPWCDFTPVNSRTYGPGDQILLARGASWNQQMTLNGSGSSSNYASLGAYGTGDRPKIIRSGNATDRAVRLNDPSYWSMSDLEVGSAGAGILVYFTTLSHEGLNFNNIYAHDIRGIHQGNRFTNGDIDCTTTDRIWNSAGLVFTAIQNLSFTSTQYAVRNVEVSNFEGTRNQASISFDYCNGMSANDGVGADGYNLTQNVLLRDLYLHDDNGPAEGCDEGLRLVNLQNATIVNAFLDREAGCFSATGTAGVIIGRVKNLNFVNSIVSNVPDTGSNDQGGIDFECCNIQARIRNSLFIGNAGPGVEFLGIYNPPNPQQDNEVTGSLFVDNAKANDARFLGAISRVGNFITPTGSIRDNLYSEPSGFLGTSFGGNFDGFTLTNNRAASAPLETYYAGYDFSSTQGSRNWSYQTGNGSSWSNLNYDASLQQWKTASSAVPFISRFGAHPDDSATNWVARAWSAPRKGVISVRGRVLKTVLTGGNGVVARITQNGAVVWGPQSVAYNDLEGLETNLDSLSVNTGDVLRFEVNSNGGNNNYDNVSWTPAVAYTLSTVWDFSSGLEGWTLANQLSGSTSSDILNLNSSGNDPYMLSPDNLNISTSSFSSITVRLKNGTASTAGQIYFTTTNSGGFDETKSVGFSIIANDGAYTTYIADMSSNVNWVGTLKQLRLDPSDASGTLNIDYIQLVQPAVRWDFNTTNSLEGWTLDNQLSGTVSNGTLNLTSSGPDPYMKSSTQSFLSMGHRSITVRMKHTTSASFAQVYFITSSDSGYSELKSVRFPVTPNDSNFRTYTLEMSNIAGWAGTITQLRFDPSSADGSITVDYIQVN